uniref:Synaptobrevin-like 1 n=1 Tax=Oryzias sinensis TaxID=183150 RepID=A0A8C7WRH5_9TELE
MAILFAVVARGTTILAKHSWCGGNFLEVTEQILAKIPSENNKLTYSHGSYLFHYICHDRIIYLCITDDDFERSRAFTFLGEVKKRFQTTYGSRAQTALPYAMNSEFSSTLAAQMKHHSDPRGSDRVTETQMQVDDLKGIMIWPTQDFDTRVSELHCFVHLFHVLSPDSVESYTAKDEI